MIKKLSLILSASVLALMSVNVFAQDDTQKTWNPTSEIVVNVVKVEEDGSGERIFCRNYKVSKDLWYFAPSHPGGERFDGGAYIELGEYSEIKVRLAVYNNQDNPSVNGFEYAFSYGESGVLTLSRGSFLVPANQKLQKFGGPSAAGKLNLGADPLNSYDYGEHYHMDLVFNLLGGCNSPLLEVTW